jgi:hypothetical protein
MGFYIRKSKKIGPFKVNLSKSGVGLSVGVKGARIGTGPRGAYVHAGRNGLYYRRNISSGQQKGPLPPSSTYSDSPNRRVIWLALLFFLLPGTVALITSTFDSRGARHAKVHSAIASAQSPTLASAQSATLPDVESQRKEVMQEMAEADRSKKAFKAAQFACLHAVENDSHVRRDRSWIIADRFYQMSYYFTHDDPRNPRIFTAYNYDCDASSGTPVLSNIRKRVDFKR